MGNCGSSQPKQEDGSNDVRINNDSRQRQRQTTAMAVGSNANNVEISPEISKSFTDKRTEENEQLRVIVSATNRKFIGVASLSYETPPGVDEASQRYKIVVAGVPPRIPATMFALPALNPKQDTSSLNYLLTTPMDNSGDQVCLSSAESLATALDDISIPINPQELIVEWSVVSSSLPGPRS